MKNLLFILPLALILMATDCRKTADCPGFNTTYMWPPYKVGDTINFVNQYGSRAYLNVTTVYTDPVGYRPVPCGAQLLVEAGTNAFGGDNFWTNNGYQGALVVNEYQGAAPVLTPISDSSNYMTLGLFNLGITLSYSNPANFDSIPANLKKTDSLLPKKVINGKTYYNVLQYQVDSTTSPAKNNIFIWKMLFTYKDGILGFYATRGKGIFWKK